MLGLHDASIWLAYLLSLGSAILCVVYGAINWNKESDRDPGGDAK